MNMNNDIITNIGVITVGSVPGGANAKPITIGGNSLTLGTSGNNVVLQAASTDDLTLDLTPGNTITLASGNNNWIVNQPRTLTIKSPIVGTSASTLALSAPGGVAGGVHGTVQLLAASPNMSANVTIGGPNMNVVIGDDQSFGTGNVFVNSFNSAPQLVTNGNRSLANTMTWASGFGLESTSTGNLTLTGAITLTGTANQNRTVNNTSATKTVFINGDVTTSQSGDAGSVGKIFVLQTNPGNIVVNGKILDQGGLGGLLTKTMAGTATINSTANTYAGQTIIQAGTLEVALLADQGTSSSLGTGATTPGIPVGSVANTATLRYIGTTNSSTNRPLQLAGTTGGATLDSSGAGTMSFTSATMGAPGAGAKTLTLTGTNTGVNTLASVVADNSATNTTTVSKTGTGNWQLTGNNTHSGGTTIDNGGLGLGHKNAAGTGGLKIGDTTVSPSISLSATTPLTGANAVGNAVAVNKDFAVSGSNDLELSGAMNLGAVNRAVTVSSSGATIFSGVIGDGSSGTGGITKAGGGVLTLTGANTYGTAGATSTTVSAGKLLVNNTTGSGTGPGDVLVNGGTLGGTGSIAGSVTVTSGHLSPGASINHLDIGGSLNLAGGAFDYEINSTSSTADLNTVAGNLSLSNVALSAAELGSGMLAFGTKFTLINYGGTWNNGIFTGLPNYSTALTIGANRFQIKYDDTTGGSNFGGGTYGGGVGPHYVTITAVPEASTVLIMGLGGVLAIAAARVGKRMGVNVLNV
jgi:autotransporter-associated beta strand protein